MTVKVWDSSRPQNPLVHSHERHREFITGLDWSLFTPRLIATSSLDRRLCVFDCLSPQPFN
jgi:peroxin-7